MIIDEVLYWDEAKALRDHKYTLRVFTPVITGKKKITEIVLELMTDNDCHLGDNEEYEYIRPSVAKGLAEMLIDTHMGIKPTL